MVSSVANGQIRAAPNRTGQIGHEVGSDGDGVRLCAFAARTGHVTDQAVQTSRVGFGYVAMHGRLRLATIIDLVGSRRTT